MAKQREADSLGEYLRGRRGSTSIRAAAARVKSLSRGEHKISEGRWRQVEAGYELKGGHQIPVHPKPVTVAWMCLAVGGDIATGLELAGLNPGHYPELVQLGVAADRAEDQERAGDIIDAILEDPRLPMETKLEMIRSARAAARVTRDDREAQ